MKTCGEVDVARARGIHWIRDCVGPGFGVDSVEKIQILPTPGLELRPFGRPTRNLLLYLLR
jgi:hypothetical protein